MLLLVLARNYGFSVLDRPMGCPLYVRAPWQSGMAREAWREGVVFENVSLENGHIRYNAKDHRLLQWRAVWLKNGITR